MSKGQSTVLTMIMSNTLLFIFYYLLFYFTGLPDKKKKTDPNCFLERSYVIAHA